MESTVQDLESKGVHLASEATTLKSTLERKETQIAEMQKMIDLQNEVSLFPRDCHEQWNFCEVRIIYKVLDCLLHHF